jgi:hypothetical protein
MNNFSVLDNLLWACGFGGHLVLLFVLLARRRVREFPIFTSLISYQIFVTVALFLISRYGNAHAYYLAYWILSPGDYAFQVALIFEIARHVLRPTGTWVQDARMSFLLWSLGGMLAAFGLSLAVSPPGTKGLYLWEVRATVFTSLLTCEIFLAMSTAANRLGLLWRSHVMALGQGLTIWAIIALLGDLVHLTLGWKRSFVIFDHVQMFVYLGALTFWAVAFWLPERVRPPLPAEMQIYLVALHRRVQYDMQRMQSMRRPPL